MVHSWSAGAKCPVSYSVMVAEATILTCPAAQHVLPLSPLLPLNYSISGSSVILVDAGPERKWTGVPGLLGNRRHAGNRRTGARTTGRGMLLC
jgi:hypothetical protein